MAERYLRALEIRSRFAHTHARELAAEVLGEARRRAKNAGGGRVRARPQAAPPSQVTSISMIAEWAEKE